MLPESLTPKLDELLAQLDNKYDEDKKLVFERIVHEYLREKKEC